MDKNTPAPRLDVRGHRIRDPKPIQSRTAPEPPPVAGARWIPLSRGYFALVDEADFESVSQRVWTTLETRTTQYAYFRRLEDGKNRCFYLHRVIMEAPAGMDVDHINGNGLDCRRANMRVCTHRQNLRNQRKRRGEYTSDYKGVSWEAGRRCWIAQFRGDTEVRHIGRFDSEEEAARAYDRAALEHFGEFARLNFPQKPLGGG